MSYCEIEKDGEFVGRYECATHGVSYFDSDKNPKELCPVGEVEDKLNSWKSAAESQNKQWSKKCEEVTELKAEVERLKAHTWEQERAAVIDHMWKFITENINTLSAKAVGKLRDFARNIERGKHWPTEGGKQ